MVKGYILIKLVPGLESSALVLAQVMSLILLGDYTSFYLAVLNRVDPTPIDSIDFH